MKKLLLITTIIIFTMGSSLAIAQEQAKTSEVLQLELQVLQSQAQSKVNELNRYLIQVEFLRLKIPAVQTEIQELNAQVRKKVSEIRELEKPVEEAKEEPKEKS